MLAKLNGQGRWLRVPAWHTRTEPYTRLGLSPWLMALVHFLRKLTETICLMTKLSAAIIEREKCVAVSVQRLLEEAC